MPKAELYTLADKHEIKDNYVEEATTATILMAKRGCKTAKKIGTYDSNNPRDKKKAKNKTADTSNEEWKMPINRVA